jgi:hypothetical protein
MSFLFLRSLQTHESNRQICFSFCGEIRERLTINAGEFEASSVAGGDKEHTLFSG